MLPCNGENIRGLMASPAQNAIERFIREGEHWLSLCGAQNIQASQYTMDILDYIVVTVEGEAPEDYFLTQSAPDTYLFAGVYEESSGYEEIFPGLKVELKATGRMSEENKQLLRDLGMLKTRTKTFTPTTYETLSCGASS